MKIIIAYYRDSAEREANLEHCLALYPDAHVEPMDKELRRGAAYNRAWKKYPTEQYFCFLDCDCWIHPIVEDFENLLTRFWAVLPTSKFRMHDEETSRLYRSRKIFRTDAARTYTDCHWNSSDGCIMLSRSALQGTGGWNERIFGWGGDHLTMEILCRRSPMPCLYNTHVVHHLWHPRDERAQKVSDERIKRITEGYLRAACVLTHHLKVK